MQQSVLVLYLLLPLPISTVFVRSINYFLKASCNFLLALSDEDVAQFQHMTEEFIQYALVLWNQKQDTYNILLAEQFCCLNGKLCERVFEDNLNCVTKQIRAAFSVGETLACFHFLSVPDGVLTECIECKILSVTENDVTVEGVDYGTIQNITISLKCITEIE